MREVSEVEREGERERTQVDGKLKTRCFCMRVCVRVGGWGWVSVCMYECVPVCVEW